MQDETLEFLLALDFLYQFVNFGVESCLCCVFVGYVIILRRGVDEAQIVSAFLIGRKFHLIFEWLLRKTFDLLQIFAQALFVFRLEWSALRTHWWRFCACLGTTAMVGVGEGWVL
jgi:hypothetical protein